MAVPTNLYASRADVTSRMPIGSVTSSSGLAAETSTSANTITLDGHGLETNDAIKLRAIEGSSLPAPLVAGVTYYARRVSNSDFELAATVDGPAIDITSAGGGLVVMRDPSFESTIEFYSRWADTFLPGHLVPLTEPIHPFVKGIVADLVAKRMLNGIGKDSAVVSAAEIEAKAQLERFVSGLPLRGAPATASANLAVTRTVFVDPRGWGSRRLP